MVLLALSAVFPAFAVEVLAFSLVEAEGGERKVSPRKDPAFYNPVLPPLLRLGP